MTLSIFGRKSETYTPPAAEPVAAPARPADSLEAVLSRLCAHGNPRVARDNGEWYCGVDMKVAAKGASYNVRSDFHCKTPLEAALQCEERVLAAVKGGS